MKTALVNDRPARAGPGASPVATCPACGHPVDLRQRLGTWFWRHRPGGPPCPARFNPNKPNKPNNPNKPNEPNKPGRPREAKDPPPLDPALAEHLAEVAEIAAEVGAEGVWLLRGAAGVRLTFVDGGTGEPSTLALDGASGEGRAGVWLLARFPARDGKGPGVEKL